MSLIASAVAPSSGRLTATIPPNAETLSQASACVPGLEQAVAAGDAARVGVLDDDHRRRAVAELGDQLERGIGVVEIIVAELLALDLLGLGDAARRAGPTGT